MQFCIKNFIIYQPEICPNKSDHYRLTDHYTSYEKRVAKFLKKHTDIKNQYAKTIQLMELDPFHPSLRIHSLSGKLKDLHSISINISYRISIEFMVKDKKIIPVAIGTHDEVYKG